MNHRNLAPVFWRSTYLAAVATLCAFPGRADAFVTFQKRVLTTTFVGEGPSVGDFNKDGKLDVAAGLNYWHGPEFSTKTKYSSQGSESYAVTTYAAHYMNLPGYDFNGDGWDDVPYQNGAVSPVYWLENNKGGTAAWQRRSIAPSGNEATIFRPLFADGKPMLIAVDGQKRYGWAGPAADPAQPWVFHPISEAQAQRYQHGLGAGDINGDGRIDILAADAWFEQPASVAGDPLWTRHDVVFGTTTRGGAQMYVEDLDGDGDADVVTSLDGHGWGLVWCEQIRTGTAITFTTRTIMGNRTQEAQYGAAFSEIHSLGFADLDGDGLKDIVSGKRWYAHNGTSDPEPEGTPVLYAFQQQRGAGGTTFKPFLIDTTAGSGCSLETRDLNGDGYPDLAINSKKGAYVFLSTDRTPISTLRPPRHRSAAGAGPQGFRFGAYVPGSGYFDLRGIPVNPGPSGHKIVFPGKGAGQ